MFVLASRVARTGSCLPKNRTCQHLSNPFLPPTSFDHNFICKYSQILSVRIKVFRCMPSRHTGKVEVRALPILGESGWSAPRPGLFNSRNEIRYPFYRTLGRHRGCSGWVRKISPSPGFGPRTFGSWRVTIPSP